KATITGGFSSFSAALGTCQSVARIEVHQYLHPLHYQTPARMPRNTRVQHQRLSAANYARLCAYRTKPSTLNRTTERKSMNLPSQTWKCDAEHKLHLPREIDRILSENLEITLAGCFGHPLIEPTADPDELLNQFRSHPDCSWSLKLGDV